MNLDKLLNDYWVTLTEEERLIAAARLYEGEKAILESLAPRDFSKSALQEFVFYHMHGIELPNGAGV